MLSVTHIHELTRFFSNWTWCRGTEALDVLNQPCSYDNPGAVSFDLVGACYKLWAKKGSEHLNFLLVELWNTISGQDVNVTPGEVRKRLLDWNDEPSCHIAGIRSLLQHRAAEARRRNK